MLRDLKQLFDGFAGNQGVALYDHASVLTFDDLHVQARRAAAELTARGIGAGDNVVFLVDKTPSVFPWVFGCWLTGAAFCPVDRDLPPARVASMLADLQPRALIGARKHEAALRTLLDASGTAVPIHLFVDDELPPLPAAAAPPPFFRDAVAYIIFTSGSTGRPKGVQITQANLVAFLNAFGARYGRGRGYRYLSLGPLFFDMTVLDCFVPLAYGASTYLYNQPYLPGLFASVVERHRINCFSAVPSVLSRLITHESAPRLAPRFGSLKLLLLGAEPFGAPLVKLLLDTVPGLHIINAYGPTEGSVCCFSYELDSTRAAGMEEYPVGYPFEGVRWQLKTADGAWTTRGTGTLYVGGDQVMRGYASRPAETAARIVTLDGVRYYNTGDVIEIDDRGRAIFRGREDDEVKLSGFRVHLLDVVRNLEEFPQLESPVAMKVTIGGDECLAVAFAAAPDVDVESVPRRLKAELPLYMIPRVWIACVEIPRLPNGKVDRTAVKGMIEQTIAGMDAPASGGKALIVRQERGPIDVGGRAMTAAATPN